MIILGGMMNVNKTEPQSAQHTGIMYRSVSLQKATAERARIIRPYQLHERSA